MEETKTKLMKVKASVDTNHSPKKSPQSLSATQRRDNNDSYLDSFPAGYRFCPFDAELIIYYLKKKLMNQPLPPNKINDVNLYHFNPHDLAQMYKGLGEKEEEFYFFTPRDRKYRNGTRPNRAAGDGYWKATGADKSIKFNRDIVGFKKTLVFYKGKPPKGDKTFWIMHEYRVNDDSPPRSKTRLSTDMRLDDWVLCRIYYKERVDKSLKSFNRKDDRVSCEKTSTYNRSYMHHPNWEQNAAAVSQIGSFKDVAMDEQFQHDGTGMDMLFGSTNDIFWSSYHQDNFCFETHLDFTNRFEDTLIVKDLSDNFHN